MGMTLPTDLAALAACPFCGGPAMRSGGQDCGWVIECATACTSHIQNEAAAITAWNTRALASRDGGGLVMHDGKEVTWVAEVFTDWTTLQIMQTGDAYAFNRVTGRVCKLPDPACPFVIFPPPAKAAPLPGAVGGGS
jgi:hypothetical protein